MFTLLRFKKIFIISGLIYSAKIFNDLMFFKPPLKRGV